jgi:hypothetical protein
MNFKSSASFASSETYSPSCGRKAYGMHRDQAIYRYLEWISFYSLDFALIFI